MIVIPSGSRAQDVARVLGPLAHDGTDRAATGRKSAALFAKWIVASMPVRGQRTFTGNVGVMRSTQVSRHGDHVDQVNPPLVNREQVRGTWNRVCRAAALLGAGAVVCASQVAAQQPSATPTPRPVRRFTLERKPWAGDLDVMIERRTVRFLVPYGRTLLFTDRGVERGLAAELARDFERYLNRRYAKVLGRRPVTVLILPTTRDKLLPNLVAGLGDIAAGNLTATDERLRLADFVAPRDRAPVREVVVIGPGTPPVATLDDLSGKTVYVRPSSSYYASLLALNATLAKTGKPPVVIASLPDALEDEDVLEMLNAGGIGLTVVDSWKAQLWAHVLPKIRVREDLVLRSEGYTGWAIRHDSPKLRGALEAFYTKVVKRQGIIETRLVQYQRRLKQISNNASGVQWKRFEEMRSLFRKYGEMYRFDPLMLTAQGFQESHLNQNARSHAGAVGVMQIMPATGAWLRVGDVHRLEPNIHAGAKYMDKLMTEYFPDANFSDWNRPLFAFASYNAGPGNIARMRRLAKRRGLDPDQWFNNVELVTSEKIGVETTTYVRNIYKYYATYALTLEAHEAQQKAREVVPTVRD